MFDRKFLLYERAKLAAAQIKSSYWSDAFCMTGNGLLNWTELFKKLFKGLVCVCVIFLPSWFADKGLHCNIKWEKNWYFVIFLIYVHFKEGVRNKMSLRCPVVWHPTGEGAWRKSALFNRFVRVWTLHRSEGRLRWFDGALGPLLQTQSCIKQHPLCTAKGWTCSCQSAVVFNWHSQENVGFNKVSTPLPFKNVRCWETILNFSFFLGHYCVLLKAPLFYSRQWQILMDPAGVCLGLMVPVWSSKFQQRSSELEFTPAVC